MQDGEDRRVRDRGKGGRLDRCQLERPIQTCRVQDVRRALVLFTSIPTHGGEWARASPTQVLIAFAESQRRCVTRLGLVQSTPWTRSPDSARRDTPLLLRLVVTPLFSVCGLCFSECDWPAGSPPELARPTTYTLEERSATTLARGKLVHEGMSGFDSSLI